MKCSTIEGFSPGGKGFLLPKKSLGLGARDKGLTFEPERGLELTLGAPGGLKVLALGFGLNSIALTLNLAEVVEVGVRTVLDAWEPTIGAALIDGRLDDF